MITGLEEFLGYLAERLGLDLRDKSTPRRIVIVSLYSLLGFFLLLGGGYYALAHLHETVELGTGIVCALIGAVYLARIAINIRNAHASVSEK